MVSDKDATLNSVPKLLKYLNATGQQLFKFALVHLHQAIHVNRNPSDPCPSIQSHGLNLFYHQVVSVPGMQPPSQSLCSFLSYLLATNVGQPHAACDMLPGLPVPLPFSSVARVVVAAAVTGGVAISGAQQTAPQPPAGAAAAAVANPAGGSSQQQVGQHGAGGINSAKQHCCSCQHNLCQGPVVWQLVKGTQP